MWSHEISAATGQFTQQALMQNAYARQINPFDNRSQAEALTGNMINRGMGFAAPIAKFAGGLAGLDSPLSGALTWGGVGAMVGGPLGAGVGAGLGAIAGTTGAIAQFGVGNFMTGMQQQQGLNTMLRQQYGFMRPGGYGFTGADMGGIGANIRSMSHQVGPGGEMHSFAELSQLVSNMGRMGFSQNVTDARQFTQKFRQMVDTLKTVSKELGTSLQAAQEMVVGMRQSGIFNTADQIKMAQGIRANNLAGISMEASSQMANVGSQIARSIGGLGRSGAFAGMRSIQQVGAAMKVGALSEEDVYNATGLTGEQGQMALAQNQMAASARFLKSGRGRYLLASMAGAGGKLNEEAAAEFAEGGFGVGRTRERAYQNLGRVGRADFIRNEGRLRAEVLNKFGGNVNTLALMGWAGERGVDIGAMGDREMLFAQRMLGMGRDEMDVAVKQANAMGDIGSFMKRQGQQDDYLREMATIRKNTGLEGVKNTFNRFREHAQSKVQHVGQRAYQDMSNWVERQLNKMFGTYETQLDAQLDEAYSNYISSGGTDIRARTTLDKSRQIAGMSSKFGLGAGAGAGGMSYSQYQKLAQGGGAATMLGIAGGGLLGPAAMMGLGRGGMEAMGAGIFRAMGGITLEQQGGFAFRPDKASKLSVEEQFQRFQKGLGAFAKGATTMVSSKEDIEWVAEAGKQFGTGAAGEALRGKMGVDRAKAALELRAKAGNARAIELLGKLNSGTATEADMSTIGMLTGNALKSQHMRGVELGAANPFSLGGGRGPETEQDRIRRLGTVEGSEARAAVTSAENRAGMLGATLWGMTPAGVASNALSGAINGWRGGGGLLGAAKGLAGGAFASTGLGGIAGSVDQLMGGRLGVANWLSESTRGSIGDKLGRRFLTGAVGPEAAEREEALGRIMGSREGREQFFGMMGTGGAGTGDKALYNLMDRERKQLVDSVKPGQNLTPDQEARLDFIRHSQVAFKLGANRLAELAKTSREGKKPQLTKEEAAAIGSITGKEGDAAVDAALQAANVAAKGVDEERRVRTEAAIKQGQMGEREFASSREAGMYTETGELGKVGAEASRKLREQGLGKMANLLEKRGRRLKAVAEGASATEGTVDSWEEGVRGSVKAEEDVYGGMSAAQMLAESRKLEGYKGEEGRGDVMATAAQLRRRAKSGQAAQRTLARGGEGLAAGKWMGMSLDRDTQRRLVGARGDIEKELAILGEEGGLSEDQKKEARKYMQIAAGKKTGDKALDEEMAGKSSEERARIARQGLGRMGAEAEKKRKEEAAKEDPSYKQLEAMAKGIDKLVQALTQEKGKEGTVAKPVQVQNETLNVKMTL